MDNMTTSDKLLAQDDIDALLGEAGIEGDYDSKKNKREEVYKAPKKKPVVRFAKRSNEEVKDTVFLLYNKAYLKRDDDVKVIWNALGTLPMVSGSTLKIQDSSYVSLGILHENHLVVKCSEENE